MLREADELRHRPEILIEVVELIESRATAAAQARESVKRAVDAAIVREVEQFISGIRTQTGDHCRHRVLIRMHMRRRPRRNTTIHMREVYEWSRRTGWVIGVDGALVDVHRARVEVGRGGAVGNSQQRQIVSSLLHPAPGNVATIADACAGDRRPVHTAVDGFPNAAILRVAVGVQEYIPDIHLIAPRHDADLATIHRAAPIVGSRLWRASGSAKHSSSRLIGEPRPRNAVR